MPARFVELDGRSRLGVEIASAKACLAAANFDEALTRTIKGALLSTAGDLEGDALGYCVSLMVSKDPCFGKR